MEEIFSSSPFLRTTTTKREKKSYEEEEEEESFFFLLYLFRGRPEQHNNRNCRWRKLCREVRRRRRKKGLSNGAWLNLKWLKHGTTGSTRKKEKRKKLLLKALISHRLVFSSFFCVTNSPDRIISLDRPINESTKFRLLLLIHPKPRDPCELGRKWSPFPSETPSSIDNGRRIGFQINETNRKKQLKTWQKRDRIPFSWKSPAASCHLRHAINARKKERGGERLARILLLISKGVLAAAAAAVAFWLL